MRGKKFVLAAFVVVMPWWAPIPQALADQPQEDQPGWSCVDDGNRICGPGNDEGKPAGCYDDGGVMVAAWPCYVQTDPQTGDTDVFTPDDRRIPASVY
jgi:hypothetical protein